MSERTFIEEPVIPRFMQYVKMDTTSVLSTGTERERVPSCEGQEMLAMNLCDELEGFGVPPDAIIKCDDGSFLLQIPASTGLEQMPHVCFAAHLDTYFGCSGQVSPMIWPYDHAGDIKLPNGGVIIPAADLKNYFGNHIITADGTSLLGADDKAGVAAMMTMIERLAQDSSIVHGPLTFWFCVDEEIGELDITQVAPEIVKSWDILWTVDGEHVGPIDVGCLICRKVTVEFTGVDAHPGVSGHKLKPAHYALVQFLYELTQLSTPMETKDLQPFDYITKILESSAGKASCICGPRSFDQEESDVMLAHVHELAEQAAEAYDVQVEVADKILCGNTEAAVLQHENLLAVGELAHRANGFPPERRHVRGGTDGAMVNMTYPDLPAPNMGTGAHNLHGLQEFLVAEQLIGTVNVMQSMIDLYAEYKG